MNWKLVLAFVCVSSFGFAAPSGKLAFIRDGGVFVGDVSGYPKLVSKSTRAKFARIAPDGRSLVFFNQTDSKVAPLQGFIARAPFDSSAPLSLPVSEFPLEHLSFSPDSSGLFVTGLSTGWKLEIPEFRALLGAPNPKAQALKFAPLSSAKDGSLMAFVAGSDVRIMNKNKVKMIFTPAKPELLLEQVKIAASSNLAFQELLNPESAAVSSNWLSGAVGLRPDGNILYFASNLGTGISAIGNSSFVFFAVQLSTMRIRLLSKLGVFHGSMPSRLNFAPDGSKFAFFSQFTLNPNEWLQSLTVCELNLEKPIEMLVKDPSPKPVVAPTSPQPESVAPISSPTGEQLLENGVAWSPDSKFLAFSVAKYAAQSPAFKIFIKDVAYNKTLLKIPNAVQPSWGTN
jgi:WD40-like Beta Propeller Repeat